MTADFQIFSSLRHDPALVQIPSSGPKHAGWNSLNPSPLYMLDFHRDRMLRAARHWGWNAAIAALSGDTGLSNLAKVIQERIESATLSGPMKVRVAISSDGSMSVDLAPVAEAPLANLFPRQLPVLEDASPSAGTDSYLPSTSPEYEVILADSKAKPSEYTHFKTTKRDVYNKARQLAHISLLDKKEVLIVNETDGVVMECSTTTPYFWRNGRWVTPLVSPQYSPNGGCGGQDGTSRRWALERYVQIAVSGRSI